MSESAQEVIDSQQPQMIQTHWQCDCGSSEVATHKSNAGVWEVIELIYNAHSITLCSLGFRRIRVKFISQFLDRSLKYND